MAFRFAYGVLRLARRNVHYQLSELIQVARSFCHESSMPRSRTRRKG